MEANDFQELDLTYREYKESGQNLKGVVLGERYVVDQEVGRGGFGQVYKGIDLKSNKEVAIKILDLEAIRNQPNSKVRQIRERLADSEPKLMKICKSENLLKCYDVYQNEELKVLVLEYCNGTTLQFEIEKNGPMPEKAAIKILGQIIDGVKELHQHKIVHRDLKSENIMSHNGIYKIIDFGFSKKLEISNEQAQVKGTSLGTITTMAPEVMKRKPYGLKADIWSIGIIFFHMIYGIWPYTSVSANTMYSEITEKKLFVNGKPLTVNGITPSQEVTKFFADVIQVDAEKRLDWKELIQHPLFKKNSQRLEQQFSVEPQLKMPILAQSEYLKQFEPQKSELIEVKTSQKYIPVEDNNKLRVEQSEIKLKEVEDSTNDKEEHRRKIQEEEKQIKQTMFKIDPNFVRAADKKKMEEEKKAKEREEEERKRPQIRRFDDQELKQKRKKLDKEEDEIYQWSKLTHLECLKTELIYTQIFEPIQKFKILDLEDRGHLQFMYLLIARCFNNMSPIRLRVENQKYNRHVKDLYGQVEKLYTKVYRKFEEISQRLTKAENKVMSMVGDWFKKKLSKADIEEKDKFLTGIQIAMYSKEEQLKYTNNYIQIYMKDLKEVSNQTKFIKNLLKNYISINGITMKQLEGITFDEYVHKKFKTI